MANDAGPADRPPNFVFILGDDWGWGDLGCFGHPRIQTPCLDRLAAEGTRFTQFYVAAPVCSPSRAAFMTGRFPSSLGIHTIFAAPEQNRSSGVPDWLDPGLPSVTRLLQAAGYATGHFGKWHLGRGDGVPEPGAYGIDDYRTTVGNGPTWDGSREPNDPYAVGWFRPRSTELIVDETIRFVEATQRSSGGPGGGPKPFYVQVWLNDPHAILNPTDEQMRPYAHLSPQGVAHRGATTIYYAVITEADRQIGRLLTRLDQLGLSENTVVVFTGDNGPEDILIRNASHSGVGSAGPFRGRKRSLYEGGVRMPLIVRWPGHTPAGAVDDDSVLSGVDLLPTACRLAGGPLPSGLGVDGEDVSAALLGTAHARSRPLHWEWRFSITGHPIHRSPMLAVRDGAWKLLLNPDRSRVELYDVPRDPMELNNLAPAHPDVVEALAARALAWRATLPPGPVSSDAGSNAYAWPTRSAPPLPTDGRT